MSDCIDLVLSRGPISFLSCLGQGLGSCSQCKRLAFRPFVTRRGGDGIQKKRRRMKQLDLCEIRRRGRGGGDTFIQS